MQICKLQWTPCYLGIKFLNKKIHGHILEKEVHIIDCNGRILIENIQYLLVFVL